jgi:hypothetical protein
MTTHDFVYQTFVIYLFIKSLVFAPLLWLAFMYWWSGRQIEVPAEEINTPPMDQDLLPQPHLYEEQVQDRQAA